MYKRIIQAETAPPSRWDPFLGHVRGWQAMLFVYAMLSALLLAAMIGMLWQGLTPVTAADTERHTVSFEMWGTQGKMSQPNFYTAEGARYQVSYALDRMAPVKAACATGETFVAYVRPDSDKRFYRVYSLTSEDGSEVYMAFEDANREKRADGLVMAGFFLVVLLLWNAFVFRSIQVARHPERYSRKTIEKYFKPGAVK